MTSPLPPEIAQAILELRFDPDAEPEYEALADALVWPDEWSPAVASACKTASQEHRSVMKRLWAYRSSLVRGAPMEQFRLLWEGMERNYPSWPGLRVERRSSKLLPLLETMGAEFLKKFEEGTW